MIGYSKVFAGSVGLLRKKREKLGQRSKEAGVLVHLRQRIEGNAHPAFRGVVPAAYNSIATAP